MEPIQTHHKGYTIRYSENEDKWRCYEMDVEHVSLGKVRQKIDRILLEERKSAKVPCLYIESRATSVRGLRHYEVVAMDYRFKIERSWGSREQKTIHEVGIMVKMEGDERPKKRWVRLETLAPMTDPRLAASLEAVEHAHRVVDDAKQVLQDAYEAIPELPLDELGALVTVAEGQE